MHNQITQADAVKAIGEYAAFLRNAERSEATIAKCIRDLRLFFIFLSEKVLDKLAVLL